MLYLVWVFVAVVYALVAMGLAVEFTANAYDNKAWEAGPAWLWKPFAIVLALAWPLLLCVSLLAELTRKRL